MRFSLFCLLISTVSSPLRKKMAGKSPESNVVAGTSGDLNSFYAICDADDEILPEVEVEEEMVEKVMHELLKEINGPVPGSFPSSAGFVAGESCGPAFSGSSSTVMAGIEMSSGGSGGGGGGGDFTVGGEVGVLGVFSGFVGVGFPAEVGGGGNGPRAEEGRGKEKQCSMHGGGKEEEEEMRMDGYDGEDSNDEDDDEWLTMFLNYAPPELDWL